jgi:hypothetical protein
MDLSMLQTLPLGVVLLFNNQRISEVLHAIKLLRVGGE